MLVGVDPAENCHEMLKEVSRVLRPGGLYIVVTCGLSMLGPYWDFFRSRAYVDMLVRVTHMKIPNKMLQMVHRCLCK